ncbi:DUF6083 domain-containing protein [Streptomyces purpureus]|nr:DUF6083 domain-containing protein [Streptomyces purpureus]
MPAPSLRHMGEMGDISRICQSCQAGGPTVRERGRGRRIGVLCGTCWDIYANRRALEEGATAPARADPGPDDVDPYEPPACRHCGALVGHYPTTYDRWVHLALGDLPARDVAPGHRWRLETVPGRHTRVPVGIVAVRVRGIEPLPGDLVRPAHRAVCLSWDAAREAEG